MIKKAIYLAIAGTLLAGCVVNKREPGPSKNPPSVNMSHAHMRHVMQRWRNTPDQRGLLPTAMAEARIAIRHANLAASKRKRLRWMKAHIRHVVNAVNPRSTRRKAPGLGYGVMRAARGVAAHVNFAARSRNASGNVRFHAQHVAAAANNTVSRAQRILRLANRVRQARTARQAARYVLSIRRLAGRLISGADRNNDGRVTWKNGEGGLAIARKHMGFMWKRERM